MSEDFQFEAVPAPDASTSRRPVDGSRILDEFNNLSDAKIMKMKRGRAGFVVTPDGHDAVFVDFDKVRPEDQLALRSREVKVLEVIHQGQFEAMTPQQQRDEVVKTRVQAQLMGPKPFDRAVAQSMFHVENTPTPIEPEFVPMDHVGRVFEGAVSGITNNRVRFIDGANHERQMKHIHIDPRFNVDGLSLGDSIRVKSMPGNHFGVEVLHSKAKQSLPADVQPGFMSIDSPPSAAQPISRKSPGARF
ncbi:hypothetical protein LA345_12920 [Burkholderia vietnamiensis]|uniref:Uncharacterized protein n=1 Tax=Burkholderia vietnamiensis (strain G4 / LMG 22486) TaxID=269482 RepID=A4JFK1_BURVG|nr:hypothetical protein Bcep1808_2052 [Burkholderia vietnamiensis G4]MCB4344814.1 hypothetical protein [Burkholderia vietnamiensis]